MILFYDACQLFAKRLAVDASNFKQSDEGLVIRAVLAKSQHHFKGKSDNVEPFSLCCSDALPKRAQNLGTSAVLALLCMPLMYLLSARSSW